MTGWTIFNQLVTQHVQGGKPTGLVDMVVLVLVHVLTKVCL